MPDSPAPRRAAPRPLILALDIGTSSTRALLYDAAGRLQRGRDVQIKYSQRLTPDGGVEFDPEELLERTLDGVRQLVAGCDGEQKQRIVGVAASCFWHAMLGLDGRGRPVTPLYSWADTRARIEVERLQTAIEPRAYHRRTGAFVHSSFWPAKIAWLRACEPAMRDKVRHWASFYDFLTLRLSGELLTSISTASGTGLLNEETCQWDADTLRDLSLSAEQLPRIAEEGESFRVRDASLLPGLPDVPWYPAYGDGACSNVGAGGVDEQRIVANLSTSGAIRVVSHHPRRAVPEGLFRYRLDRERWLIGGAVSNGGNVYAWLNRSLQLPQGKKLEQALAATAPDAHGLTVLPFWAGERSPGWHAVAQAAVVGLNLSTTPLEMAQASLEAVAYTMHTLRTDLLAAFPTATQVIVSGGALEHSKYMPKLFASVFDTPVRISLDPQPSGRGAALILSERLGLLDGIDKATDRLSQPILPDPDAVPVYAKAQARYQTLYDLLVGRDLQAPVAKTERLLQNG